MDLTQKLKDWLCEQVGIAKNADDETFRKAASQAIAAGTLTPLKLAELTAANGSKSPDPRDESGGSCMLRAVTQKQHRHLRERAGCPIPGRRRSGEPIARARVQGCEKGIQEGVE